LGKIISRNMILHHYTSIDQEVIPFVFLPGNMLPVESDAINFLKSVEMKESAHIETAILWIQAVCFLETSTCPFIILAKHGEDEFVLKIIKLKKGPARTYHHLFDTINLLRLNKVAAGTLFRNMVKRKRSFQLDNFHFGFENDTLTIDHLLELNITSLDAVDACKFIGQRVTRQWSF